MPVLSPSLPLDGAISALNVITAPVTSYDKMRELCFGHDIKKYHGQNTFIAHSF